MRAARPAVILAVLLLVTVPVAAAARITFERTLPAPHDLGGTEDIAVVFAIGDHAKIESFLDHFLHQTNRAGALRVRDRRGGGPGGSEAQLSVRTFTCTLTDGSGEGSTYDVDGNRVKRKQVWVDTRCVARVDVAVRNQRSSFYVKGEGTSPRVDAVTDEERNIALEQAARYAAVDAAERLTPRRVRESIPLEDSAPAFDEGMALITLDRLAEARAVWERVLKSEPRSAPLHYNLAAVCEAMGDRKAAEQHYTAARELAPGEKRYANELRMFAKRTH